MRPVGLTVWACASAMLLAVAAVRSQGKAPEQLAAAREAMGGAARLASVRTLALTVRDLERALRPEGVKTEAPLPFEFFETKCEIQVLLPDHFRQVDQSRTFPGAPSLAWGFAGKSDFGPGKLRWRFRETFGYFVLALLLKTDSVFAFALQGIEGGALHFIDPNGVDVFVDVDPATHLPQSMRYDLPERTMSGQLTGKRRPTRVAMEGYASVDRLRLPHILRTYFGDVMMTQRRVESIRINPVLTPESFK